MAYGGVAYCGVGLLGLDHHTTNLPHTSTLCTLPPPPSPSGIRPQGSQAPTYHLPTCCLPASLTPPPSLTPIRDSASRVSSTWCWTRPTSCSTWTLSRQDTPHSCLTLFSLLSFLSHTLPTWTLNRQEALLSCLTLFSLLPHTLLRSCLTLLSLLSNSSHSYPLLYLDTEQEIDQILKVIPRDRRTQLFSATMTNKVQKLQRACLVKPVKVRGRGLESQLSCLLCSGLWLLYKPFRLFPHS